MPEQGSPESLIGRQVSFFWVPVLRKPVRQTGKVVGLGRAPGVLVIEAIALPLKKRAGGTKNPGYWAAHGLTRSLHSRLISEIEVLA